MYIHTHTYTRVHTYATLRFIFRKWETSCLLESFIFFGCKFPSSHQTSLVPLALALSRWIPTAPLYPDKNFSYKFWSSLAARSPGKKASLLTLLLQFLEIDRLEEKGWPTFMMCSQSDLWLVYPLSGNSCGLWLLTLGPSNRFGERRLGMATYTAILKLSISPFEANAAATSDTWTQWHFYKTPMKPLT